jgi:hypothetical protein
MKRKKMFVLFLFFLVAIGPSIAAADVPVSSIPERIYRATFFLSDHLLFLKFNAVFFYSSNLTVF